MSRSATGSTLSSASAEIRLALALERRLSKEQILTLYLTRAPYGGNLEGVRVAVFGGRAHYYESGRGDAMRLPLEVLKALGGDTMIATNAAGSMVPDMATGSIMCLSDHINFSGLNPLIGEQTDARFVPMKDCYDPKLREVLTRAAMDIKIEMHSGVYAWYSGPHDRASN